MTSRYAPLVRAVQLRHRIQVRRWRTNMTGCAWRVYHPTGRTTNYVESPLPKTPISLAIFLHEVGHHVIGFDRYKRRCEEEYHAWLWALAEMRRHGIEPDARTLRRVELSLRYAVDKAQRRGIRTLPAELTQYASLAA